MKWWDRLLGRVPADEREEHRRDKAALDGLHDSMDKVYDRTARLERELLRVNREMRQRLPR